MTRALTQHSLTNYPVIDISRASALSAKHTSFLPWLRTPSHRGRFLGPKSEAKKRPNDFIFCRRIRRARGSTLLQPAASGRLSCRVFGRCGKHRLMAPRGMVIH